MNLSPKLYGYYDKFLRLLGQDNNGGIKRWYRNTSRTQDIPKDVLTAALTSDVENSIRIITDEPTNDAPDFKKYTNHLSKLIVNSVPRFTVGIYGGWGTGKTTIMQMIKDEIDRNHSDNVKTVWFDAWRYEKEQYSAMVPLLRTISLSLKNTIENSKDNKKKYILTKLEGHVSKLGGAILRHTNVNMAASVGAGSGGVQSDIGKIMDDYKSDGSIIHGQERIYFHKHITDHLREELQKIREIEKYDFRLVIFVDDLDRCTPERALELLESIKTFFDIEGIVYVIGIDPTTIDSLIQTKYGKKSKVEGMDYLQKIVQLTFQIPVWSPVDLSKKISAMIERAGMNMSEFEPILKQTSTELIINAAHLNPRDIKRFVNSVILATYVYEHDIKDIEKLIAVQAFYFHGNKWLDFLKLLIPYKQRIAFLTHFILWLEKESAAISNLYDLDKILQDDKNREKDDYVYKSLANKSLLDIYKKIVDIGDDDLFTFLKVSKETLLGIDKIERYLKVLDTTGITSKVDKFLDIDSGKQLELLRNQDATEFNKYVEQGIPIHLPFVHNRELVGLSLQNFHFDNSLLFRSDLSVASFNGANLSKANLSKANLSKANLSKANLVKANLFEANLSKANLSKANLSKANLSKANLTRTHLDKANLTGTHMEIANLTEADLVGANLSKANLSKANLTRTHLDKANLTGARLYEANLTGIYLFGANLSEANLSGAKISTIMINCRFSNTIVDMHTDFSDSVIDNPEFLKYTHERGSQNIPDVIKNKQELREKLRNKRLAEETIDWYVSLSQLPEKLKRTKSQ